MIIHTNPSPSGHAASAIEIIRRRSALRDGLPSPNVQKAIRVIRIPGVTSFNVKNSS